MIHKEAYPGGRGAYLTFLCQGLLFNFAQDLLRMVNRTTTAISEVTSTTGMALAPKWRTICSSDTIMKILKTVQSINPPSLMRVRRLTPASCLHFKTC